MKFKVPNKQFSRVYQRFLYRFAGGAVLLLSTTGRNSGRVHTIGLQYEVIDGKYWVGAADGEKADWYRNLQVFPKAQIQAGAEKFNATAELLEDPHLIADFLVYRIRKRPLLLRLILLMGGLRGRITPEKLLQYARNIRVAVLSPDP